jgi:hypothetical protein
MANQILQTAPVDLDVLQESALAMAQATIQNAMDQAKMKPVQLARNMGQHRSFVSRMLNGRHNLTVKTFALAMAGCGYRLQFGYAPLKWGWAAETTATATPAPPVKQKQTSVPTSVGTLVGMNRGHNH